MILEGPFEGPTRLEIGDPTADPPRAPAEKLVPENLLTDDQKLHREADEYVMAYILQGIPYPIYRSVDAQKTAKAMWEHVHLLMEGTQLNKDDMESKLYKEYTGITIEPGESLESYYHRFTNVEMIWNVTKSQYLGLQLTPNLLEVLVRIGISM